MKNRIKRIFILIFILFNIFAASFYFLVKDQIEYANSPNNIVMPEADGATEEIVFGKQVSQNFINRIEEIERLDVSFSSLYKNVQGKITIDLLDGDKTIINRSINLSDLPDDGIVSLSLDNPVAGYKDKTLTIKISSTSPFNHGVVALIDSNAPDSYLLHNDKTIRGSLCFSLSGRDKHWLGIYYWHIFITLSLLLGLLLLISYKQYLNGKANLLVVSIAAIYRYSFLISQLVSRDFKSKYKRSVFGVLWSFLNPLLTMTVQFLVFSTFFKADTQNYPIYLLSGVVCFSFFSECTNMCLSSISANARLITKVYIPKYIFPLSRTISSSINLGISLIPLFLACLVLGSTLKIQSILFFYFLICLIIFSLGIGLFLSALMVFFRDIQFLWTVIIQIWMYATPIFYPAEIIPEEYKFIVRFNPLYHFIGNARTCLINGVSPEPRAYLFCLLFALGSLAIGAYTFKKTQDNFALYL